MTNGTATPIPAPEKGIQQLIEESKGAYGILRALKHKKFWSALAASIVPWTIGYHAMQVDGLLGFWFIAVGIVPHLAYILGQSYVDGQRMRALGAGGSS